MKLLGTRVRLLPLLILVGLTSAFWLRSGATAPVSPPRSVLSAPIPEAVDVPPPVPETPIAAPASPFPPAAPKSPPPAPVYGGAPWAERPADVTRSFEKSRRAFLEEISSDLGLTDAQRGILHDYYRGREDEVQALKLSGQAGQISSTAYLDGVGAANDRFYDRIESFVTRDQALLLGRFRKKSQAAVEAMRKK